jgi:hypothetical protein
MKHPVVPVGVSENMVITPNAKLTDDEERAKDDRIGTHG